MARGKSEGRSFPRLYRWAFVEEITKLDEVFAVSDIKGNVSGTSDRIR